MIVDLQGHGHLPFDALFPIYPGRFHQTSPARDPGISTCRPTWRNRAILKRRAKPHCFLLRVTSLGSVAAKTVSSEGSHSSTTNVSHFRVHSTPVKVKTETISVCAAKRD